jgi:hypothetical protein
VSATVWVHMSTRALRAGPRGAIAFWALAGLALLVSHDAIYLAQIGPGEALTAALRSGGHGYWGWASLGLVILGLVAGIGVAARLGWLSRRAADVGAEPSAPDRWLGRFGRRWWRLALVVGAGVLVQENVEHYLAHGHVLGAGALIGPEQPLAIPVIGLVSALAGAFAALVSDRHRALVEAILAVLRHPARAPRATLRPPSRLAVLIGSVLAGQGAGRAPPAVLTTA